MDEMLGIINTGEPIIPASGLVVKDVANPTIKEVLTKKMLAKLEGEDADAVADTLSFKTLKEVAQMRESRPKFAGATLADSSDTFYAEGPNEANFEIRDTIVTSDSSDEAEQVPGDIVLPGDGGVSGGK